MNKNIDISTVTLKTPRLTLRPWMESDLEDFYEYARVDGVGQMAGWVPHNSIEESRNVLNSFIRGKKTFALDYAGKVIGSLGIEAYNEEHYPEFAAYEKYCRFGGCSHINEPVCGVKEALSDGEISPIRYGNYKLLYAELKERKKYN